MWVTATRAAGRSWAAATTVWSPDPDGRWWADAAPEATRKHAAMWVNSARWPAEMFGVCCHSSPVQPSWLLVVMKGKRSRGPALLTPRCPHPTEPRQCSLGGKGDSSRKHPVDIVYTAITHPSLSRLSVTTTALELYVWIIWLSHSFNIYCYVHSILIGIRSWSCQTSWSQDTFTHWKIRNVCLSPNIYH